MVEKLEREANKLNPLEHKAANSVRWKTLCKINERARKMNGPKLEKIALDIFIVAYTTSSQRGEIAA